MLKYFANQIIYIDNFLGEKAIQEIRSSVVDLSIEAASKILEKNLDSEDNRKLVDQTLDSMGQV